MADKETVQEPENVEAVREIALLSSYPDASARLGRLEEVQCTATLDDIAEWAKVKNKHTVIKGDGVEIDKDRNRLDIRNRVRTRFGLPEVDSSGQTVAESSFFGGFSGSVRKNISW